MADTSQNSLFELSLDHESIDYLTESARWGKFLAIVGFITCGLIVIFSFFAGSLLANNSAFSSYSGPEMRSASATSGALLTFIYLVVAVVYFFPCLFLYRYSVRMKAALKTNDQVKLNQSLKNQKLLYRYIGIVTIIAVSLEVLLLLIGGVAGLFFH
jgi:H+/Cl- antiporter ClcA